MDFILGFLACLLFVLTFYLLFTMGYLERLNKLIKDVESESQSNERKFELLTRETNELRFRCSNLEDFTQCYKK